MGLALAILVICLVVLATGLHIGGAFLGLLVLLMAFALIVTLLGRFVRWALGRRVMELEDRWESGGDPGSGGMEEKRVCPDPHCGRVNEGRARFCAQCGKPLP